MVFTIIILYNIMCVDCGSGGFDSHETNANNTNDAEPLAQYRKEWRQVAASVVEGVWRGAGAAGKVCNSDLSLTLVTLTTQTALFYTVLALLTRLVSLEFVVHVVFILLSLLYTNDCGKCATYPTSVHFSLTCFSVVYLFIQECFFVLLSLCLLLHYYILHGQKCQRH